MPLSLRRMGHILEGAASKIASRLRAAPARAYVSVDGTVGSDAGYEANAFMEQPQSDTAPWT